MSRVVNPNAPGKVRNYHRRTIAELLRRLSQHAALDQAAKDMTASMAIALRGIHESTLKTVEAWEKRDYWTKADRFLREWEWAGTAADELEILIADETWPQLPLMMAKLMPHFVDVEIKKMTRKPAHWQGAHRQLLQDLNSKQA